MKQKIAIMFVALLFLGFIKSGSYTAIESGFNYLKSDKNDGEPSSIDVIESQFTSSMWMSEPLINLNGLIARKMRMHGLYSDMGLYVTDDYYIVSSSDYTSTDYEYQQIVDFRDFLESNGIKLLYVNEPNKYLDDNLFRDSFGVESYSNRNMDTFMQRIREAGVNTIDLRDNIKAEDKNIYEMFYRTDHHWTVPTGLWAASIIAKGLNEYCGYNIDLSLYDISKYELNVMKHCWLGEQGKKMAVTYVGADDFTEVKPSFSTSYIFKNTDGTTFDGTFDNYVNEYIYDSDGTIHGSPSWHYSYMKMDCINNNVDEGKVLILGDSYDYVMHPFLSLGVHEADFIILRDYDDSFRLRDYILDGGYDTVIIAYAQFMLGAHDDETSANYKMFSFDK